jgi:hypothetical protein
MSASVNNVAPDQNWFPVGTNNENGWRLDIVSLLAVIGESSMAEHSQAMTASWLCCLPRIIPAPQVLLKPTRPSRLPHENAEVVGVENGTSVPNLNYFANILHPIDLPAYAFKVYKIEHSAKRKKTLTDSQKELNNIAANSNENGGSGENASLSHKDPEGGPRQRKGLMERLRRDKKEKHTRISSTLPPHVPAKWTSPLNLLSIFSFVLTVGLFILSAFDNDGVACLALILLGMVSSIVGYASLWSPRLMKRYANSIVPQGDVVIRTREGAFIVVKCNEDVARELYTGTEECIYSVQDLRLYRGLVGVGTFLLMLSVVLLGNCNFNQQLAIGVSYIVLNGFYWGTSLFPKKRFWDLSIYEVKDETADYWENADHGDKASKDPEQKPSFTRTLWYAIYATKQIGWVKSSGAAPKTNEWDQWLIEAKKQADAGNNTWKAATEKDRIVGQTDPTPNHRAADAIVNSINIPGGQQAPVKVPPPNDTR